MPNISEWNNTAERNFYPFVEGCVDSVREVFADLNLVVPDGTTAVHLSSLVVEGSSLSGTFLNSSTSVLIGTFSIDLKSTTPHALVTSGLGAVVGTVVVGERTLRIGPPIASGQMRLDAAQGGVHPSCLVPVTPRVVRSIQLKDGTVFGRVYLVEGDGIRLVKLSADQVRIDAVGGSQKSNECCEDDNVFLKGINDATPDEQGNIGINLHPHEEPDDPTSMIQMLRMETSPGTITFSLSQ